MADVSLCVTYHTSGHRLVGSPVHPFSVTDSLLADTGLCFQVCLLLVLSLASA